VQFARRFHLAQWYRECSLALAKLSNTGTSADTASVASETGSTDVPRRKKTKKGRRQSGDSENADAVSTPAICASNSEQLELKQTQQWLFTQMQTGLTSAAANRFVFSVRLSFCFSAN